MSEIIYSKIYLVIFIWFLVGGIGLFWMLPAEKRSKQIKIKFWVYVFIVLIHILLIQFYLFGFQILSLLALFIGLYEIHRLFSVVNKIQYQRSTIFTEVFYLLLCWCYYQFICMETAIVLFLFLIVFSFDGLSQLTGAMVGKNKMLKQISPGKTWEGLAGGIIGTFLIVLFIKNDFSPFLKNSFITWLLIIFFAFVGDVLASLLKRISGVKDFGRLIPGHGGVLDRFDSMFVAGSALYLYNLILPL